MTQAQYSSGPLPLPMRTPSGFLLTGRLGKVRIHSATPLGSRRRMSLPNHRVRRGKEKARQRQAGQQQQQDAVR